MSENSATATLRKCFEKHGAHVQRIEDKFTPGIPDMNICAWGVELWLEGKFIKTLPKRRTSLIRFGAKGDSRLAHQRNWIRARRNAGGNVFIFIRIQDLGWRLLDNPATLVSGLTLLELEKLRKFATAMELCVHLKLMLTGKK